MDALVTRDYLDVCLDTRFAARFSQHDLQLADIRGELKLHRWILAIIAASTVIPTLQELFALLVG